MQLYEPLSESLPSCPAQQLRQFTHLSLQLNRATVSCRSSAVHHRNKNASQPLCALPATLFSPYLGHRELNREIWTLVLTPTLTEDFYSRLSTGKQLLLEEACKQRAGNQPSAHQALPTLAAKHRCKPTAKTAFPQCLYARAWAKAKRQQSSGALSG